MKLLRDTSRNANFEVKNLLLAIDFAPSLESGPVWIALKGKIRRVFCHACQKICVLGCKYIF